MDKRGEREVRGVCAMWKWGLFFFVQRRAC